MGRAPTGRPGTLTSADVLCGEVESLYTYDVLLDEAGQAQAATAEHQGGRGDERGAADGDGGGWAWLTIGLNAVAGLALGAVGVLRLRRRKEWQRGAAQEVEMEPRGYDLRANGAAWAAGRGGQISVPPPY